MLWIFSSLFSIIKLFALTSMFIKVFDFFLFLNGKIKKNVDPDTLTVHTNHVIMVIMDDYRFLF